MAQNFKLKNFLDTIQTIIQDKSCSNYTGILTIKIVFNDGGIRLCEKHLVEIIKSNNSDS